MTLNIDAEQRGSLAALPHAIPHAIPLPIPSRDARWAMRCDLCRAWHHGWHMVDGCRVPSTMCAEHAPLDWRWRWLIGGKDADPRSPAARFAPSHVRSYHLTRAVEALDRRDDVTRPPRSTPIPSNGDGRLRYVELPAAGEPIPRRRRRRASTDDF